MKTIASVQASNLKGRSFNYALGPFTVVTGPNATGKSAVTDALTLALAGVIPKLGKRNQDTYRLASGQKMAVGVTFSDGSQTARTWSESRGSVKAEASDESAMPTHLLDASEYFALSDRERMKLVFRIAPGIEGAVGLPELTARIKSVVLAENTAATEAALLDCCKLAEDEHTKANKEGRSMVEWLEAVTARLKEKLTEANAAAKRMTGTAAGLTEIGREAVLFSERELKAVREKHSAAQWAHKQAQADHAKAMADAGRKAELEIQLQGLETLVGDKGAMEREVKALEWRTSTFTSQTPQIQAVLRELERALAEQKDKLTRHYAWRERVEQMRANLATYPNDPKDVHALICQIEEWTDKVASYTSRTHGLESEMQGQNAIIATAKRDQDGYAKEIATICAKRDKLLEGDCCPTCLASGDDGWKVRVRQNAAEEIATREGVIQAARKREEDACLVLEAILASLSKAKTDDASHRLAIASLAELNAKLEAAKRKDAERQQLAARLDELLASEPPFSENDVDYAARIAEQRTLLNAAKIADGEHAASLAALVKERAKLDGCVQRQLQVATLRGEFESLKPGDAVVLAALAAKAQDELAPLASEVDRLASDQRKADAAKGEQHARLKAVEAAKRVEAEVAAVKSAVAALEDLQRDLVAKAFGSLLVVANRIAAPVLRSPLEYRDGEIGRQEGRHWITQRTFSGTEQAVTYAAFAVALAAESPLKLCVLDEIGRLDKASRRKLFAAVAAALADGTVGQFIGIMPEMDDSAPAGATVIVTK